MNRRKLVLTTSLFVTVVLAVDRGFADEDLVWKNAIQAANLPPMARGAFEKKPLAGSFDYNFDTNPFYVRGDFDGDSKTDIAVLVTETSSRKKGIAVIHGAGGVHLLGAGTPIGNGSDNFVWMDAWNVYPKGKVSQGAGENGPPSLRGDALHVEKLDSASALIYWDGKMYRWYQQGD